MHLLFIGLRVRAERFVCIYPRDLRARHAGGRGFESRRRRQRKALMPRLRGVSCFQTVALESCESQGRESRTAKTCTEIAAKARDVSRIAAKVPRKCVTSQAADDSGISGAGRHGRKARGWTGESAEHSIWSRALSARTSRR